MNAQFQTFYDVSSVLGMSQSEVNGNLLEITVESNPHTTVGEQVKQLAVSKSTVINHLKQISKLKKV